MDGRKNQKSDPSISVHVLNENFVLALARNSILLLASLAASSSQTLNADRNREDE